MQEILQPFQSAWFPLAMILLALMVMRERQHLADRAKHIEEFDTFVKDCEKRLTQVREELETEYNERLEIIAQSKNLIWIKGETRGEKKTPPRSDSH